ncbi:hypothetical protein LEMLEM_LOCUS12205 [Lemmus lemmus]
MEERPRLVKDRGLVTKGKFVCFWCNGGKKSDLDNERRNERPKATAEIVRCQEGRETKCQHFVAEPNRGHREAAAEVQVCSSQLGFALPVLTTEESRIVDAPESTTSQDYFILMVLETKSKDKTPEVLMSGWGSVLVFRIVQEVLQLHRKFCSYTGSSAAKQEVLQCHGKFSCYRENQETLLQPCFADQGAAEWVTGAGFLVLWLSPGKAGSSPEDGYSAAPGCCSYVKGSLLELCPGKASKTQGSNETSATHVTLLVVLKPPSPAGQGVNPIKMPHPHDLSKFSPSNVTAGAVSPVDCELCKDGEFSIEGLLGSLLLSLVFSHYFNCGYDYKVYAIESNNDRRNTTVLIFTLNTNTYAGCMKPPDVAEHSADVSHLHIVLQLSLTCHHCAEHNDAKLPTDYAP